MSWFFNTVSVIALVAAVNYSSVTVQSKVGEIERSMQAAQKALETLPATQGLSIPDMSVEKQLGLIKDKLRDMKNLTDNNKEVNELMGVENPTAFDKK